MGNPWQDEDTLRRLYWGELKSQAEIADELNCYKTTVGRWLDKYGIEKRDIPEATAIAQLPEGAWEYLSDREWLRDEYYENSRSLSDIAESIGVSLDTVRAWMERHGIDRREKGARNGKNHHSWAGDELECECDVCGKQFRKRQRDSVGRFCSTDCFAIWRSENWTGENAPRWNGGYSPYSGENWQEQRQKALERDGYECQRCGMNESDHRDEYGTSLHIHHISRKKNFDTYEKMNALHNLVTLCSRCHKRLEGLPIDRREM